MTLHHPREIQFRPARVLTRTTWVLVLCCTMFPGPLRAQATLQQARELYLAADYEQALGALGALTADTQAQRTEIAAYQVFCLVALGRTDEAVRAIDAIVEADPLYEPPESIASPRLRTLFEDARRKALPGVAQRRYAAAKAAYDRRDTAATAMFDDVLRLLEDPDLQTPASADLRTLAEGFRELSLEFTKPPATAAEPARAAQAATPAGRARQASDPAQRQDAPASAAPAQTTHAAGPSREGDAGVTPPVAISQPLPAWVPPSRGFDRQMEFEGVIEVVIDETGTVTQATIRKSVHPQYDGELLKVARTWKFKPAVRDGKPTAYAKLVEVRLRPAVR